MNRFGKLSIAAAATALLLVGCTPTPVPPPEVLPPAPAAPTPTPAADPVEERADYGFTYFYEADLGTWEEMSAQLSHPVAGIPDCPYYGMVWGTEVANTFAFMDPDNIAVGALFFYTMPGMTTSTAPYPRNAEGVGLGSTHAEVIAAFPTAVVGSMVDLGAGDIATITVDDPDSDSKYVYGFNGGSSTVDLLQWGPGAGNQWSHLCGGF
ncbi:hypothetical protein ACX3O0_02205 [Homoserinimonas sp. A447]